MSSPSDSSKVVGRRLQAGDREALAELFSRHRERLWRMIDFRLHARLRGRVDPDDVLQEGYLAASRQMAGYDPRTCGTPFIWLRLVVKRTLVDLHRRHLGARARDAAREVAVEGCRFPDATSVSLALELVGDMTSPSRAARRAERLQALEDAIARMDPIDQEVLALRHFEELSNSEAAEVLGIQEKAASIRYVRAVRRLKEILSQVPGLSESKPDG